MSAPAPLLSKSRIDSKERLQKERERVGENKRGVGMIWFGSEGRREGEKKKKSKHVSFLSAPDQTSGTKVALFILAVILTQFTQLGPLDGRRGKKKLDDDWVSICCTEQTVKCNKLPKIDPKTNHLQSKRHHVCKNVQCYSMSTNSQTFLKFSRPLIIIVSRWSAAESLLFT